MERIPTQGGVLNGKVRTVWKIAWPVVVGMNRYVMLTGITVNWCVFLPLAWLFAWPLGWGLNGAWASLLVYIGLLAFLYIRRFIGGSWKKVEVWQTGASKDEARTKSGDTSRSRCPRISVAVFDFVLTAFGCFYFTSTVFRTCAA